jgi:hypothetical protein
MRTSTRNHRLSQSQRFLAGHGTARAYAVGEIGPDPRRTLFLILCAVVAFSFFAFVLYSVILFPGVFLIWAVYVAVERSTGVVVTDRGVAILARSEFNGRPRKFVALLPAEILIDPTVQRSGRYVHLPTYRLWLRKREYDVLTSVQRGVQTTTRVHTNAPPPWAMPAPPPMRLPSSPRTSESTSESQPGNSYWARHSSRSAPSSGLGDDEPSPGLTQ